MKAPPDNVRSYLTEIGRTPLLSSEQEIALGRKVQKLQFLLSTKEKLKIDLRREPTMTEWAERANCSLPSLEKDLTVGKEAKNHLVVANLRLVVSVAKKYQQRGLELLDLVQEGNTGLIVAAGRFNPKKGCKFSTFAHWWIRQAIVRAIQNQSRSIRLPVYVTEKLNKIKKAYRELSILQGRTPTIAEIAEYSQENSEAINSYLQVAQIPFSLEQELGEDEDLTLSDYLEDRSISTLEFILEREKAEQVNYFLRSLPPQEQKILILRYGLNSEPKTFRQIAEELGGSQSGIIYQQTRAPSLILSRLPRERLGLDGLPSNGGTGSLCEIALGEFVVQKREF